MRLFALVGGWAVLAIFAGFVVWKMFHVERWSDVFGWMIVLLWVAWLGWEIAYCLEYVTLPYWAI